MITRLASRKLAKAAPSVGRRWFTDSQIEPLIGSREQIERKRQLFEAKYADALKAAAKKQGVDVETLKAKAKLARRSTATPAAAATPKVSSNPSLQQIPSSVVAPSPPKELTGKNESGIKPLSHILDLQKLLTRQPAPSTEEISALWTAYHASTTSTTKLGAVIPVETYKRMTSIARENPRFILPLPRELEDGTKGAETIFMEWAFVPSPSALPAGTPETTTVLFTSLAAYKSHGTFAQPALILTHYTDLAISHGIVLLRGEITTGNSGNGQLISQTDAQLLCMRLQRFYAEKDEDSKERRLLADFQGTTGREFQYEDLLEMAWQL